MKVFAINKIALIVCAIILSSCGGDNPSINNQNEQFFFWGYSASARSTDLWRSDGTAEGTIKLTDNSTDTFFYDSLIQENTSAYFYYTSGGYFRLWTSDGTQSGTMSLTDNGNYTGVLNESIAFYKDLTIFTAGNLEYGQELWVTDGSIANTRMVKDLYPGNPSNPSNPYNSLPSNYYAYNDIVLFSLGFHPDYAGELWKTDGTSEGTVLVKDILPGIEIADPDLFTTFNGIVYFAAKDSIDGNYNTALYRTDGTESGTYRVKTLFIPNVSYRRITEMITNDDGLYFIADNGLTGFQELWVSDGTEAGTSLYKVMDGSGEALFPHSMINLNQKIAFVATSSSSEIWITDGTDAGTLKIKDLHPNEYTYFTDPLTMHEYNGELYFEAHTAGNDGQIWKTDGTEQGTQVVTDLSHQKYPDLSSSIPGIHKNEVAFFEINGDLHFTLGDSAISLWKTDGTEVGTVLIEEIQ